MSKKLLIGVGAVIVIVVILVVARIPRHDPEIRDWYDLHAVRYHLGRSYVLMNDLDATTAGYEELAGPRANEGKGWQPVGAWRSAFTGSFDGQSYEIRDLFINRPDEEYVGLFGVVDEGGLSENVGVVGVNVTGERVVGGLAGDNSGTLNNSYSSGSVTGDDAVGGLTGVNVGALSNCYSTCSVTGGDYAGGLVGILPIKKILLLDHSSGGTTGAARVGDSAGYNAPGTVSNSYATGNVIGGECVGGLVGSSAGYVSNSHAAGNVTGDSSVGGLVGDKLLGTVSSSYSTGSVTSNEFVGGLVGYLALGIVRNSYSIGSVTGKECIGGLVGWNRDGTVSNSYSSSNVIGYRYVGGLVGRVGWSAHSWSGYVSECYSIGEVVGHENVGGLIGWLDRGEVTDSFWDIATSGKDLSHGGIGKTTVDMMDIATFAGSGWDIVAVAPGETKPTCAWNIVDGETYPFLSWESVV